MSTKMGFWRWALASAAVVIMSSSAGARLINDPPSVTTNEPAAIVIYPNLHVDTNTCVGFGIDKRCSLTGDDCSTSQCADAGRDSIIQLTNTENFIAKAHCFSYWKLHPESNLENKQKVGCIKSYTFQLFAPTNNTLNGVHPVDNSVD